MDFKPVTVESGIVFKSPTKYLLYSGCLHHSHEINLIWPQRQILNLKK